MNTIWIVIPILTVLMFDLGLGWVTNQEMAIPAILYSLMMNVVLLTYVAIVKRKKK